MASTLNMIETLTTHLMDALPECDVLHFAGIATAYVPASASGTILLTYHGSLFATTADTEYLAQPRLTRFVISMLSPQSLGSHAALALLDRVRRAVLGLRLPDCRQVRAVQEEYLGESQAHWLYRLELVADSLWVEDRDADGGPPVMDVKYVAD